MNIGLIATVLLVFVLMYIRRRVRPIDEVIGTTLEDNHERRRLMLKLSREQGYREW